MAGAHRVGPWQERNASARRIVAWLTGFAGTLRRRELVPRTNGWKVRASYSRLDDLTPVIFVTTGGVQNDLRSDRRIPPAQISDDVAATCRFVGEELIRVLEPNGTTSVELKLIGPRMTVRYPGGRRSRVAIVRRLQLHEYA